VLVCGFLLAGIVALGGCDGGSGGDTTRAAGPTESETKAREATEAFYKDQAASRGVRK